MKKSILSLAVCASLFVSVTVSACVKPESKPEIPDANTVVTAQMVKANNEMKSYIKAMEDYISCARLSRAEERREVDELKKTAEEFNAVVRAFKARSAS